MIVLLNKQTNNIESITEIPLKIDKRTNFFTISYPLELLAMFFFSNSCSAVYLHKLVRQVTQCFLLSSLPSVCPVSNFLLQLSSLCHRHFNYLFVILTASFLFPFSLKYPWYSLNSSLEPNLLLSRMILNCGINKQTNFFFYYCLMW